MLSVDLSGVTSVSMKYMVTTDSLLGIFTMMCC